MEITRQQAGEWIELQVKGRLDSYWSTNLEESIRELVQGGSHFIRINLAEVTFLSSAGLRVLVAGFKQIQGIRGKFEVVQPSDSVKQVLALTKLDSLLTARPAAAAPAAAPHPAGAATVMQYVRGPITFGVFQRGTGVLNCQLIGDPALLQGCRYAERDCRRLRLPASTLAVGLGALGSHFADCQGRFGEFLAAAGAAAYLPTDGTNVPDYHLAAGDAVPEVEVCYAVTCDGPLTRLVRFEAGEEARRVPLSELLHACLELARSERIGLVMLAETSGLMGAALRRSPAVKEAPGAPFTYPEVRDWLTFTAERAYPRSLVLAAGVAARGDGGPLAKFVRPLGDGLVGHCHAAAFTYRPLPRGDIDLRASVASLFEDLTFQGILHLLADRRPLGLGESEFLRGAIWFSPIDEVKESR